MNRIFKRLFFGRPVSTHEELQHRLSKKVALAVFSSDALSSSAYATDEILLVLVLAGGLALQYSVGISLAVVLVLGVVVASYRQTVRAYPSGGGAYIVAKDNLGTFPGLIAASALLIDYVLTVAVSVAAGLAAVGAAFPGINNHRVGTSLLVVFFIAMLNLRGLKESGTIFAIPTYGFLISLSVLIVVGIFRVITHTVAPIPAHAVTAQASLSLFLVLKAFSSGSTAMTGIEAISNGVPAFKRPESKNASQTLLTLGLLLSFLFLGITFLARELNVDPIAIEHGKTVMSQIGGRIFGSTSLMFFAIQVFTALILFLAANTSYADFPRLASILARDRFLPRVLQNRGDKLAFSNGIILLAAGASAILIKYGALVHRIIPLYVVGVFTSFTLSQTGMIIHWLKARKGAGTLGHSEPDHWRRNIAINAFGASTTFVVLIIVATTKFVGGAWQVIVLIPLVAWLLYRINGHYRSVERRLELQPVPREIAPGKILLLVTRFKGATKALAFVRSLAPDQLKVAALRTPEVRRLDLMNRWRTMGSEQSIEPVTSLHGLVENIKEMDPTEGAPVTVVISDPQHKRRLVQILQSQTLLRIKRSLWAMEGVVVISVPFRPDVEPEPIRLEAPSTFSLIVLVGTVNFAAARAIRYAQSLRPSELRAVSIQSEVGQAGELLRSWQTMKMDLPLEILDSPYRSLVGSLVAHVRSMHPTASNPVGVVVPEFVPERWWHNLLHNQTAFLIKSALFFEGNVVVINVPYRLSEERPAGVHQPASPGGKSG